MWNVGFKGGHLLDMGEKLYRGSSHRIVPPLTTIARLQPHLASLGITRVADVTGLDRIGLPVAAVYRPNARSVAVTMGKGTDVAGARASGLMEALEIDHAERITAPLRLVSHQELAGEQRVAELRTLLRPDGEPFDPGRPLLWIEGLDLLDGDPVWLPIESVHANFAYPPLPGSGTFRASTNGLASGNHPLEAWCHGIFEVLERDATTRWYGLGRAARHATRLDLASVDDPECRSVLDRLAARGFDVAVWNTTGPEGIASFYCLMADARIDLSHPGEGAGCHPSRRTALLRAVLEAVQVRMTYLLGAREDILPEEFAATAMAARIRKIRTLMAGPEGTHHFTGVPTLEADTLRDDLDHALDRMRALGLREVIAVDLTRSALGIPVVRLVVPGLLDEDDVGTSFDEGPSPEERP